MMDKRPVPDKCLSDEVLWELAFRFAGGDEDEAAIASKDGPSEPIPGDLFLEPEDSVKDHFKKCKSCNDKLSRRILYVREYSKRTNDPDVRAIAGTITEGILSPENSKILRFCPYDDEDEERHLALAAQTDSLHEEQPLRFMSDDEELMIRSFKNEKTGVDEFFLAGSDRSFVCNATVILNGKKYVSDTKGRIDFGPAAKKIDEDSEFIVVRESSDTIE